MNTRLFEVCFSYLDEMSYSRCIGQFLEISSNIVTCTVTGKKVNRGGGCKMAKWMLCKRKKDSWGCFGQEPRKENQQHRGSSKGITVGKAVVQLRSKK